MTATPEQQAGADDRFAQDYQSLRRDPSLNRYNEIVTGPVADWATDFSHLEPEYAAHAIEVWDDLRGRCPIAHTDRFGGAWLPTR